MSRSRWLLVALVAGLIFVASVVPVPAGGRASIGLPGERAAATSLHVVSFLVLGAALAAAVDDALAHRTPSVPALVGLVVVVSVTYGLTIEVVQAFLATRRFEWLDVVADGLGAAVGVGLWLLASPSRGRAPTGRAD